jgi:hypothetical protein
MGMRPHIALQKSVENSGLDTVILVEASGALSNLRSVRIDVASFDASGDLGFFVDGIKCGRGLLYEYASTMAVDDEYGLGPTRLYDLVF